MDLNLDTVPDFLTSSSPKGLRRSMLLNNARRGFVFKYRDFIVQDGKWYCWYDRPILSLDDSIESIKEDE